MEVCEVNGKNTHEVFKYLRNNCKELYDSQKKRTKEIPWNFSKFLINREGKLLKYYNPRINPVGMIPDIEMYLNQMNNNE